MQKLSVCANKKNRKAILEQLQSLGCMEITTEGLDDPNLQKMDTEKQRQQFLRNADAFDEAIRLLDRYAKSPGKGMGLFAEREQIDKAQFDEVVKNQKQLVTAGQTVQRAEKTIAECRGTIQKEENRIAALEPWMELPVSMDCSGTKQTAFLIGTIEGNITEDAIYAAACAGLEEPAPVSVNLLPGSAPGQNNMLVICLKKDRDHVENSLRAAGFANPAIRVDGVPAEEKKEIEANIQSQQKEIEEQEKLIASYADRREDFRIASDYYRTRAAKYALLGTIPQSENMFFLEGWVTADRAESVKNLLEKKYDALVEKEEKREDEMEPTVLHNNRFSESVEGVLESYGLPQHGKIDPTFIMSIFYVIFFGMMFSDAGYGIMMALACLIVLKRHKKLGDSIRKSMQLFFWCGISTTFWGLMYGGIFGDAIDQIAHTFLGVPAQVQIIKPLWFDPLSQPMRLLVWCMGFGLVHLFFGLGIAGAQYLKDHDFVGWFSDVFSWYLFILGLVLMLLPSELFGSIAGDSFDFSGITKLGPIPKYMALAGMIIILLMQERSKKNPILRVLLGAYDVYGVTSWLSDVLSYSRLLALGLATGVIANVINMMAVMGGDSAFGVIVFILVFVLGHTLNFFINALGAYVHSNRLEFVEFFGKFYEGGGRPFKAFQTANKYVEIKNLNQGDH